MEVRENLKEGHKLFKCQNGKSYGAPADFCLFCKHCTDIFWDYTNGPYMCICELDKEYEGGCKFYVQN